MSRRSLILCFTALAAMVGLIVAAVAFLYRDDSEQVSVSARYELACAVPSNAVAVCFLSEAEKISSPLLSAFDFPRKLAGLMEDEKKLASVPMALSLHYAGSIMPLYIFDIGPASDEMSEHAGKLMALAAENGFVSEYVNCSEVAPDSPLASRSLVMIAKTKTNINTSLSHLKEGHSILEASGFPEAAADASGNAMFISYAHAKPLFEKAFSRSFYNQRYDVKTAKRMYSDAAIFASTIADWTVMDVDSKDNLTAFHSFAGVSDFVSVVQNSTPSFSKVSEMLPCYTSFALSIPIGDYDAYLQAYERYLEAQQKKTAAELVQNTLQKKTGIGPEKLFSILGVEEVATASFYCGDRMETVNLVKVEHADTVLLRKTGRTSFPSAPEAMPYAYRSYIASVFGGLFDLKDESYFTCMDGWIITGSKTAVEEYATDVALDYDLKTYMADAGRSDLLAGRSVSIVAYLNMNAKDKVLSSVLNKDMLRVHDSVKPDAEYAPIVIAAYKQDDKICTDFRAYGLSMKRSRAPKFERDTVVVVPTGPFKVLNSGTGRTNLFYQQANGAISLKEEDGKGIWGVPFKQKLCGTAHNIDYYANGNKQILFGAGSSIYLIDRKGAFVQGFPVDLGKEILLGPDVYDFNGVNSYNVMVLHKDNSIEMYNLKGKQPDSWKGIIAPETVKSLPERIKLGDNSFWVVRTSVQTLIYPFYGGQPLTKFTNNQMILPTGEVKVKNSTSVEVECYDGKTRTVKLK